MIRQLRRLGYRIESLPGSHTQTSTVLSGRTRLLPSISASSVDFGPSNEGVISHNKNSLQQAQRVAGLSAHLHFARRKPPMLLAALGARPTPPVRIGTGRTGR